MRRPHYSFGGSPFFHLIFILLPVTKKRVKVIIGALGAGFSSLYLKWFFFIYLFTDIQNTR